MAQLITPSRRKSEVKTRTSKLLPGFAVAVALAIGARWLGAISGFSSLTIAVIIGILLANTPTVRNTPTLSSTTLSIDTLRPGLAFAAKHVLRLGVIALGMRLSVESVAELGIGVIVTIIVTVLATFFGTQALGRALGVSRPLSLLIATGYSICGASAIAAMEGSSNAEEEEVAVAIGLVTLAGTVAMFAIPVLGTTFGLTDAQYAIWAGASIHDVAQVVSAGAARGTEVLAAAVVVKLTRVLLLAPLVTGVSISRNRQTPTGAARPAPIPGFVAGFLLVVAIRSTGTIPDSVIDATQWVEKLLFTIALVGLGAGVRIGKLRELGGAPLLLGALASVVVAAVSLGAVLLVA